MRLGLLDDFGRELVRQVVFADDDFDVHAEIVGVAENLDHAARPGLESFSGYSSSSTLTTMPSRSSTRGNRGAVTPMRSMAGAGGREFHAFRDFDPLPDAVVVGNHVLAAAADAEFADHGGVGALAAL